MAEPAFPENSCGAKASSGARELLSRLGVPGAAIPKSPTGAPHWPAGVTGSLAHAAGVAVAAMALLRDIGALGINVEPAEPLPADVLSLVARPEDLAGLPDDPYAGRIVFAAKEAVYKALHPIDGRPLEYEDIHLDLCKSQAITRTGHAVQLRYSASTHVVALAFAPGASNGRAALTVPP